MPNPITALDSAVMNALDRVVLTLWNWFSIPRIAIIRFAMICWLIGGLMRDITMHEKLFWTILWVIILLVLHGFEELAAKYLSPKMRNSSMVSGRTGGHMPYIRVSVIILNIWPTGTPFEFAIGISAMLWVLLSWTFVPEDPPKRPKFQFVNSFVPEAG